MDTQIVGQSGGQMTGLQMVGLWGIIALAAAIVFLSGLATGYVLWRRE